MKPSATVKTIAFDALSDADIARWNALRDQNPGLESPYHHPDYHALVHKHQGDVKVSLMIQDGEIIAFLPWQGGAFARPSGSPFSDYQSIITAPDSDVEIGDLLKGQSVGAFRFTAMVSADGEPTARMEIEDADSWRESRDGSYRRHLKGTHRRIRKAEQEVGPRRVVTCSRDIDAFQTLIAWKRKQYIASGKYDVLKNERNIALLRDLWARGTDAELRADMHALYFGDRLAACDLGLTDGKVYHSWIVSYDAELHAFAPGFQLIEGIIDDVASLGYRVIDLGTGTGGFKKQYTTHSHYTTSGIVTLPSPAGLVASTYDRLETQLKARTGDALGKFRRRYSQIAACEPTLLGRSSAMAEAFSAKFKSQST